jgi:hypothetical protein
MGSATNIRGGMKLTGPIFAAVHAAFAIFIYFYLEHVSVFGLLPVSLLFLDYPCTRLMEASFARHWRFPGMYAVFYVGLGSVWWYLIGTCLQAIIRRLRQA